MSTALISKEKIQKIKNHYIVTKQRSGSTLLSFILSNSPNVQVIHEENVYYKLKSKYVNLVFDNEVVLESFFNDFFDYTLHKDVVVLELPDRQSLYQLLYPYLSYNLSYKEFVNLFYLFFYSAYNLKDVDTVINKDITYHISVSKIYNENPKSKFVFLVRDSITNINSCTRINENTSNLVGESCYWKYMVNDVISASKKIPETNFIVVKYEDLIQNTKETIEEICNFLEIQFETDMLDNQIAAKNTFDYLYRRLIEINGMGPHLLREKDIHISTKGKIDKKKVVENSFSDKEISKINFITAKTKRKLGYDADKPNWFDVFLFNHVDIYYWLKSLINYNLLSIYYQSSFELKVFYRKINVFKLLN